MTPMYPDPPHLTVALYCEKPEPQTFRAMHEVAVDLGCQPANAIEIAPADQDFELVSDLGSASEGLAATPERYLRLLSGADPGVRVVKAALQHRKWGKVVVEYAQRIGPGRHPIAISLSAGALGFPDSLWSGAQRRSACAVGDWCRSFLELASGRSGALYGAVGVEFSLPTPWRIRAEKPRLPTDIFLSRRLVDRSQATDNDLRLLFVDGDILTWDAGVFFSGWAPFNPKRASVYDTKDASSRLIAALKPVLLVQG